MQMTPEEYKEKRNVGQMFQATGREADRRQKIDIIERGKDRKIQYGILIATSISAVVLALTLVFSFIK